MEIWNPVRCEGSSAALLMQHETGGRTPEFRRGWMTYLAAPYAARIAWPRRAICERLADGGLLMLATEDTFDADDPAHLAAALDIEAAQAPLNALPGPANDTGAGPAMPDPG